MLQQIGNIRSIHEQTVIFCAEEDVSRVFGIEGVHRIQAGPKGADERTEFLKDLVGRGRSRKAGEEGIHSDDDVRHFGNFFS